MSVNKARISKIDELIFSDIIEEKVRIANESESFRKRFPNYTLELGGVSTRVDYYHRVYLNIRNVNKNGVERLDVGVVSVCYYVDKVIFTRPAYISVDSLGGYKNYSRCLKAFFHNHSNDLLSWKQPK
jgi:hypothetical protein